MAGYSVKYGTYDLYVPGSDTYALYGMKLGMRVDQVSTLNFTMPPTHPNKSVIRLHDVARPVCVYYGNTLLFRGYITRMVTQIDMQVVVSCESDLGMLDRVHFRFSDDDVASDEPFAPTAGNVFYWAIKCYNNKVTADRQFTIGDTVGSNVGYKPSWNSYKIVDANTTTPDTALGLILDSIVEPYDCQLRVWYQNDTRYIGLYRSAPLTSGQRIEFGENMTSFEYDVSDEEFYTACYPTGATYDDYSSASNVATWHTTAAASSGASYVVVDASIDWVPGYGDLDHDKVQYDDIVVINGVSYRVTAALQRDGRLYVSPVWNAMGDHYGAGVVDAVASGAAVRYKGHKPSSVQHTCTLKDVSDGTKETDFYKSGAIVRHTSNASTYGVNTFLFNDPSIGYGPDLLAKAIELLRKHEEPTLTISVDAVDMAYYNGYTHLQAGQKVRVIHSLMGIDTMMQVTQADIDLDNPAATKYTLGAYPQTATAKIKRAEREIGATNNRMEQLRRTTNG